MVSERSWLLSAENGNIYCNEDGRDLPSAKLRELINPEFQEVLYIDYIEGRATEDSIRKALSDISREDSYEIIMNAASFLRGLSRVLQLDTRDTVFPRLWMTRMACIRYVKESMIEEDLKEEGIWREGLQAKRS